MQSLARIGVCGAALTMTSLAACATDDVQLEHIQGAIGFGKDGDLKEGEATCISLYGTIDSPEGTTPPAYEVRLNGLPVETSPGNEIGPSSLGLMWFCVRSGDYDISLRLDGQTVANTGSLSLRPQQELSIVFFGPQQAPSMRTWLTNNTSPGAGLRRLRFANFSEDQQAKTLLFFDASGAEVARSALVAYGDTWSGVGPDDIVSYGYDASEVSNNAVCTYAHVIGVFAYGPEGVQSGVFEGLGVGRIPEEVPAVCGQP